LKIEAAGDKGRRAEERNDMMSAKIEGKKLIITMDLEIPVPSKTGKTIIIATSHGNQKTDILIDGQPLTIGVNAYAAKK
jgi:hypothetical protein